MAENEAKTPSTEDDLRREVARLRGELSLATLAISHLYGIFRLLDGLSGEFPKDGMLPTAVVKIMDSQISPKTIQSFEEDRVSPELFIQGVDRFKKKTVTPS